MTTSRRGGPVEQEPRPGVRAALDHQQPRALRQRLRTKSRPSAPAVAAASCSLVKSARNAEVLSPVSSSALGPRRYRSSPPPVPAALAARSVSPIAPSQISLAESHREPDAVHALVDVSARIAWDPVYDLIARAMVNDLRVGERGSGRARRAGPTHGCGSLWIGRRTRGQCETQDLRHGRGAAPRSQRRAHPH